MRNFYISTVLLQLFAATSLNAQSGKSITVQKPIARFTLPQVRLTQPKVLTTVIRGRTPILPVEVDPGNGGTGGGCDFVAGSVSIISGTGTVCAGNNTTTLTLTGNTASTITWQSSTDDHNFSAVGSGQSYTAINLTQTTFFRVAVTNDGSCFDFSLAQVIMVISNLWVHDADNDGHYIGSPATQCGSPGAEWVAQTTQQAGDCDDGDPAVWQSANLYIDSDQDGFDNGQQVKCYGATIPAGYSASTNGSDCDDTDPTIHAQFAFLRDEDGDGYGAKSKGSILICAVDENTPPAGYSTKDKIDCDDSDPSVWQSLLLYIDQDGDGYDNGQEEVCYGATIPARHSASTNGSDCDDTDPNIHTQFAFLRDEDGDGYGVKSKGGILVCAVDENTPPAGYSTKDKIDCDDGDPSVWQSLLLYIDRDGDGYDNGQEEVCYGATIPAGYSLTSNGNDCKDDDPTIYPGAPEICDGKDNNCNGQVDEGPVLTFYFDEDGDGYGNPGKSITGCSAPSGYVADHTDCNDKDPLIHVPVMYYLDKDHDGYGSTATAMLCSSSPPLGYSTNNTDCNDDNPAVHSAQTYYLDADHDGYGDPAKTRSVCSSSVPPGYVSNNGDCNDNDSKIHSPQTYYQDNDRDGYGNPANSTSVCSSKAPSGYVSNSGDCNDNDSKIHSAQTYYVDADRDGYGSKTTALLCSSKAPTGYATNNSDCDDNNPAVHPGAVEVCGNAIDDNCNNKTDEGCTVCQNGTGLTTTNITKSTARLNWTASVSPIVWQVDYKRSTSTSWTTILLAGPARSVNISSLSSNQTYNWRIKALCGKTWTGYSATINFKTLSSSQTISQRSMSLEVEEESSTIKLYPNPNNGQFVIQLGVSNEPDGNAKIQMIDVLGRIVHTENASLSSGKLQKTVTMPSQVTRGVYMLRIIINDKAYQTKLIYQ